MRLLLIVSVICLSFKLTNQQNKSITWLRDGSSRNYLANYLLLGCTTSTCTANVTDTRVEFSGYDGWYNNLARPDSGAIDRPLLRRWPARYADGTYLPDVENRPNPVLLSERLLSGEIGSHSRTGKNALLVFFGQQVVEEILDAQRAGCPPEYFNIEIPEGTEFRNRTRQKEMPFLRSRFDQRTGLNPNNPRQQLNEITPYLDGGLIYGITKQWADQLRTYSDGTIDPDGKLAHSHGGDFPEYNTQRLPLANPPPPFHHKEFIKAHEIKKVSRFFKLGNPRGNENTFLLTFGILWFRWHNYLAGNIRLHEPTWSSDKVFNEARKWVIATQQHIVLYEWLPSWLDVAAMGAYRYDPSVDPQIDQFFQAAAFRFGHTLVTPGVYMRDYGRNGCRHDFKSILGTNAVRTCNAFWRPQDALKSNYSAAEFMGIDRLLMGMAYQLCEEEDHKIVEDLRGNVFGPLEFPRRDLMAINIQRGRDHGLPDFNSARIAYGLQPITLANIHAHYPQVDTTIINELLRLYENNVNNIDPWIGGILETSDGPGELFTAVIVDQFKRIRNADRFWYENEANGLFTEMERNRLKQITVYDIIMAVTKMDHNDIQKDVFRVPTNASDVHPNCSAIVTEGSCATRVPVATFPCFHLNYLNAAALNESCVQGVDGYDYFSNSEASFILSFTAVGTVIVALFGMIFILINIRNKQQAKLNSEHSSEAPFADRINTNKQMHISRECVNLKGLKRHILISLNNEKKLIEVICTRNTVIRSISCSSEITMISIIDQPLLVINAKNEYSLVLEFDASNFRTNLIIIIKAFLDSIACAYKEDSYYLKQAKKVISTHEQRKNQLDMFFQVAFAQAYKTELKSMKSLPIQLIADTKLSINDFADSLNMRSNTSFVSKFFKLIDKDNNGYISFIEFVDMLNVFARGDAMEKARLLFKIYDISRSNYLSEETFREMIRSFLEIVKGDVDENELKITISAMLQSANIQSKKQISFDDFIKMFGDDIEQLNKVNLGFTNNINESKAEQERNLRPDSIYMIRGALNVDEGMTSPRIHSKYSFVPWIEKFSKEIFWVGLYTLVLLAIFAERAYYYSVEREHSGLRRIAGYGVTVTRGAASAMMFTFSSLLVTMCRNIITKLRDTIANKYFPFDSIVEIHKYIAYWALAFTILHIIGHAFNFYHISTQTADDLTCLFRNYFHATHELPKFHYWCWQTMTGFTGIVLTILTAFIYIFSLTFVRQKLYNWFWYTHSLYPFFFIFLILHGSGRLIQEPFTYYFLLGPIILFVIDQIISINRRKVQINVINANILKSGVTMLEFERPDSFDYKSGQWVRIACLGLNQHEYHPFTISTSPDEPTLTLHIRAVGPWTENIRNLYEKANIENEKRLPKIYLDGPYGEGHQDWNKFEVSILIGGGIGVTPFASILKDIVFKRSFRHGAKFNKVYFMWISKTQKQFEWLLDLLREIEVKDKNNIIDTHIYITQFYAKLDLRTVMLYVCDQHYQKIANKSLFTNLEAVTHFGRPNFDKFFRTIQSTHQNVSKIGVFSCGPPTMISQADQACFQLNNKRPNFEHHFKIF